MHFGLPVGFLFGLLPALCVGGIDWFLADKLASKPRLIVAIVTGYFAAAEMLMLSSGDWNWSFGLIGAIAAAICSWMSDEKRWTG
jgi:hypothetical protein